MLWPNKNPPLTVFMDKNPFSPIPPDVVGVWEHLPFRDNVFHCIIFDPPHKIGRTAGRGLWATPTSKSYYGIDISHKDFRLGVYHGTREFLRVADRLCFKWNDIELSLFRVLSLFPKEWREVHQLVIDKGQKTRTLTYWTTFVKREKPLNSSLSPNTMTNMDEKKSSWAPQKEPTEEELKEIEEDAVRAAQMDVARMQAGFAPVVVVLEKIYQEIKRANDAMLIGKEVQVMGPEPTPLIGPVQKIEETELSTSLTVPQNLKEEDDITNYYTSMLAEVRTRNGEPLPDYVINGAEIRVEEDRVTMKLPWIKESNSKALFAALREQVGQIGGQWVAAGRDSHWILPKP